jgi:hypothetical protein
MENGLFSSTCISTNDPDLTIQLLMLKTVINTILHGLVFDYRRDEVG